MKHIKKKFRYENSSFFEEIKNNKNSKLLYIDEKIDRKVIKSNYVLMQYNSGNEVLSFPYKYKNELFLIPMPEYPLMYYNQAYMLIKQIDESKNDLLKALRAKPKNRTLCDAEIYSYFGCISSFVLNLHCAFESFANRCIADKTVISTLINSEVKLSDPQKNAQLFEKVDEIIPMLYKKIQLFKSEYIADYHLLKDLHNLRNELAHTKTDNAFNKDNEVELFKKLMSFNYIGALIAVKKFSNYYVPDYMVECDCNNDF